MLHLTHRPRRLRADENWRRLVRETRLSVDDLIWPLFVQPGEGRRDEIASMPRCYRLSVDELVKEAKDARDLGIPGVILFGIPPTKDAEGSSGYDPAGIVPQAIKALRAEVPDLLVWADVCLCEYTSHGHCGLLAKEGGDVLNDATVERLARAARVYADAGAHAVCPSDMMDGRVGAIRDTLDAHGHENTVVVAYSAKYSSAYYGPFRDAADSTPSFGDRRTYQMDPGNGLEALREVELDIAEGADMVMVKPALAYLDVIRRVADEFDVPVAAYNVSGEYSMLEAAIAAGYFERERVVMETLGSIRRAGAEIILTYHAKEVARWIA